VTRPQFDPTLSGPVPVDAAVDCREAVRELYIYLDGELTEERRIEIKMHLDMCRPCGTAVDFEADLRKVIAQRCRDHVPDTLIARVAEALQQESQTHGEPV
jgi:mycothiol system anti-sigma-R factor